MEKIIYEFKPYALLLIAITALYYCEGKYLLIGYVSAALLSIASAMIIRLRYEHRTLKLKYSTI